MQDFEPIKQSYRDFADKYKLHIAVAKLGYTPTIGTFDTKGYQHAQFHYQVKLTGGAGKSMTIDWHCGEGIPTSDPAVIAWVRKTNVVAYVRDMQFRTYGRITIDQDKINKAFIAAAESLYEPSIVDILECLKSDLSYVYYEGIGFAVTFEEFCGEMGMNSDSISDKQCYEATMEQSQNLLKLLGVAGVVELLALEGL